MGGRRHGGGEVGAGGRVEAVEKARAPAVGRRPECRERQPQGERGAAEKGQDLGHALRLASR
jgi:hypothetical protein